MRTPPIDTGSKTLGLMLHSLGNMAQTRMQTTQQVQSHLNDVFSTLEKHRVQKVQENQLEKDNAFREAQFKLKENQLEKDNAHREKELALQSDLTQAKINYTLANAANARANTAYTKANTQTLLENMNLRKKEQEAYAEYLKSLSAQEKQEDFYKSLFNAPMQEKAQENPQAQAPKKEAEITRFKGEKSAQETPQESKKLGFSQALFKREELPSYTGSKGIDKKLFENRPLLPVEIYHLKQLGYDDKAIANLRQSVQAQHLMQKAQNAPESLSLFERQQLERSGFKIDEHNITMRNAQKLKDQIKVQDKAFRTGLQLLEALESNTGLAYGANLAANKLTGGAIPLADDYAKTQVLRNEFLNAILQNKFGNDISKVKMQELQNIIDQPAATSGNLKLKIREFLDILEPQLVNDINQAKNTKIDLSDYSGLSDYRKYKETK